MSNLSIVDLLVIAAYFLVLSGIAYWAARKEKNVSSDFFLASRDVGWLAVGASLFASNIGSEHLVGLAGTGAASGLAVGHFEWLASFILLLLGWLFVPFYLRSGVYTMPEFLERRYNPASRSYFTWVSIVGYVLTKISVTLFAGGVVMRAVTGYDFWTSAAILIVITGLYTIFGGLRAVIFTEVMQAVVLIVGSITLMFIGLHAVGGWSGLRASVPPDFFSMWKPSNHKDFPWTGVVFGAPILGIWYWCTDQHIVQRVLAARNIQEARRGTIFAGYLKILPVFIFVLPGIIAAALSDLHLFAERSGVHRAADRGRVPVGNTKPTAEWEGRSRRAVVRFRSRFCTSSARARQVTSVEWNADLLVRKYQLPPLRRTALPAVQRNPGSREHDDTASSTSTRSRSDATDCSAVRIGGSRAERADA